MLIPKKQQFGHLRVPPHWEQYWSRYPQGYTIMEALINWVSQVDKMVDNVNDWNEYLDEFVQQFDTQLQGTVINILREWQEDGTLDIIIDEALQTQIDKVEGEVIRNTESLIRRGVDPVTLGADPTGTLDSTEIFIEAFNLNKHILLPPGTFLVSNLDIPDGCTITGSGKTLSIMKKSDGGYMIDLGRQSFIFDCGFDGNMEKYTGATIRISRGDNVPTRTLQGHQRVVRCAFDNSDGYHVEYTQPNKGWMSRLVECDFGDTRAEAAVKWPDETTNGGNRYIIDCYSSKPIVNVGGADNGIIAFNTVGGSGENEEGIVFPDNTVNPSKKIVITGNRFAIANGTIRVRGFEHVLSDNNIAGNVILEESSTGCKFSDTNVYIGTLTNNNISNTVFGLTGTFRPEWTASTNSPDYGNATVTGFWRWEGRKISVSVEIIFGSTTNFGEGTWRFSLPIIFAGMSSKRFTGSAFTNYATGTIFGTPASGYHTIYRNDVFSTLSSASFEWKAGDRLLFDYEYTLQS